MSNYIYGYNTFKEAVKNNRISIAYTLNDQKILNDLNKYHVNYKIVDKKYLDKISNNGNHNGIVCLMKSEYKQAKLQDMIKKENGLIIVLDGLKDPHNLGAIMRTCDIAGADGIIYKSHDSVKVNDTVAKVSCGAIEYVKYLEVTNITSTLKKLKENGYWVIGTDVNNATPYNKQDYNMNVALVIGSEEKGISPLVKKECDFMVNIPNNGHIDSLNASVATAVLIFKIVESRLK